VVVVVVVVVVVYICMSSITQLKAFLQLRGLLSTKKKKERERKKRNRTDNNNCFLIFPPRYEPHPIVSATT
jgi:hypothetical protein